MEYRKLLLCSVYIGSILLWHNAIIVQYNQLWFHVEDFFGLFFIGLLGSSGTVGRGLVEEMDWTWAASLYIIASAISQLKSNRRPVSPTGLRCFDLIFRLRVLIQYVNFPIIFPYRSEEFIRTL